MPVYYDMQKKIPMIYSKKEFLNGSFSKIKRYISPSI